MGVSDCASSCESETESFHSSVSDVKPSTSTNVENVRSITENFQMLLAKATKEIKKLKKENSSIEEEQKNLQNINEELSRETERLVREENTWKVEREGLLKTNEEF